MLIQIGPLTRLHDAPLHFTLLSWQAGLFAGTLEHSTLLHSLPLKQSICHCLTHATTGLDKCPNERTRH